VAARLRDPAGARTAMRVLVGLGPDAAATLRAASLRGPAPEIALELQRALASLEVEPHVPGPLASPPSGAPPLSAADFDALAQAPELDALTRAIALRARLDARVAAARLGLDTPVHERRSELAVVALAGSRAALGADDLAALGRVMGWSRDGATAQRDRCLAALALRGTDRHGDALELAREHTTRLLEDADPMVRAWAVPAWRALTRRADERALLDPDARVRTLAILAAWAHGSTRAESRRIALLAATDPDRRVREAARFVARTRERPAALGMVHRTAGGEAGPWLAVRTPGGASLWLPAIRIGGLWLAAAPGLPTLALAP
ncbi:MAG: hypothetical protein K1X88_34185, partial [Nannocystaceae bacterium]|nr:hypothetical protein [Nannocystaceae bacterium]